YSGLLAWISTGDVETKEYRKPIKRVVDQPPNAKATRTTGKPPTLADLFKSDLGNTMKFTDEDRIGIQWNNGDVLRIKTQVYADFPAKTQFMGFYIPPSPKTHVCGL